MPFKMCFLDLPRAQSRPELCHAPRSALRLRGSRCVPTATRRGKTSTRAHSLWRSECCTELATGRAEETCWLVSTGSYWQPPNTDLRKPNKASSLVYCSFGGKTWTDTRLIIAFAWHVSCRNIQLAMELNWWWLSYSAVRQHIMLSTYVPEQLPKIWIFLNSWTHLDTNISNIGFWTCHLLNPCNISSTMDK